MIALSSSWYPGMCITLLYMMASVVAPQGIHMYTGYGVTQIPSEIRFTLGQFYIETETHYFFLTQSQYLRQRPDIATKDDRKHHHHHWINHSIWHFLEIIRFCSTRSFAHLINIIVFSFFASVLAALTPIPSITIQLFFKKCCKMNFWNFKKEFMNNMSCMMEHPWCNCFHQI